MRHVVVIAVAIIFLLLITVLKQHKERLLIIGVAVLSLISGVYCYAKADSIVPKRYPVNQTFYDPVNCEIGEFPDAFLRLLLKGKKVHVKGDRITLTHAIEQGEEWLYAYYHVDNMVNYLNATYSTVEEDESLNECEVPEEKRNEFENLGYLNDLLRNTVMYSSHDIECGNFTYYLWYYSYFAKTSYMYLQTESLDEDELVLIWQPRSKDTKEDRATEDMYLMGKSYFEENIRKQ